MGNKEDQLTQIIEKLSQLNSPARMVRVTLQDKESISYGCHTHLNTGELVFDASTVIGYRVEEEMSDYPSVLTLYTLKGDDIKIVRSKGATIKALLKELGLLLPVEELYS